MTLKVRGQGQGDYLKITIRNWFHFFQLYKHLRATQLMQKLFFFALSAAKHVTTEKDSEKVFSIIYPQNYDDTSDIDGERRALQQMLSDRSA